VSLISSLYIGQNGLSTSSLELGVIGDNIANAGTIGFKSGRASFADLVGESLVGGGGEFGLGSRLVAVQQILTQGSLATTGISTDLAISGPGLFVVRAPDGGVAYTRNGQFTLDANGFVVDLQGNRVQGFPADATGTVSGALGDLQPGQATAPPRATTSVTVRANLDSQAVPPALPFDSSDPTNTSNFSATTQVFDSLGKAHDVTTYFRKNAEGSWEWHSLTDGAGVEGGVAGTDVEINSGVLTFDTNGKLLDATETVDSFFPVGATLPQELAFDFGSSIASGGTGEGISQFAQTSAASFLGQDGFAAGDLAAVAVDPNGNVTGTFTNGQTRVLGQVGLADFPAADQLQRAGNNLLTQTVRSGEPNVGAPATGGRGSLFSGTLEQSNVDVATELVKMIVVQRGFQANSKTVSTADALLAELIQIKR
jgi:flagellar hook protein FlgE